MTADAGHQGPRNPRNVPQQVCGMMRGGAPKGPPQRPRGVWGERGAGRDEAINCEKKTGDRNANNNL